MKTFTEESKITVRKVLDDLGISYDEPPQAGSRFAVLVPLLSPSLIVDMADKLPLLIVNFYESNMVSSPCLTFRYKT